MTLGEIAATEQSIWAGRPIHSYQDLALMLASLSGDAAAQALTAGQRPWVQVDLHVQVGQLLALCVRAADEFGWDFEEVLTDTYKAQRAEVEQQRRRGCPTTGTSASAST